jgi:hypothetical protein
MGYNDLQHFSFIYWQEVSQPVGSDIANFHLPIANRPDR